MLQTYPQTPPLAGAFDNTTIFIGPGTIANVSAFETPGGWYRPGDVNSVTGLAQGYIAATGFVQFLGVSSLTTPFRANTLPLCFVQFLVDGQPFQLYDYRPRTSTIETVQDGISPSGLISGH